MNLDFSADPLFSWYVVLLIISGVAMIVIGAANGLSTGWRVFNALAGIGFIGYGIYLGSSSRAARTSSSSRRSSCLS